MNVVAKSGLKPLEYALIVHEYRATCLAFSKSNTPRQQNEYYT